MRRRQNDVTSRRDERRASLVIAFCRSAARRLVSSCCPISVRPARRAAVSQCMAGRPAVLARSLAVMSNKSLPIIVSPARGRRRTVSGWLEGGGGGGGWSAGLWGAISTRDEDDAGFTVATTYRQTDRPGCRGRRRRLTCSSPSHARTHIYQLHTTKSSTTALAWVYGHNPQAKTTPDKMPLARALKEFNKYY